MIGNSGFILEHCRKNCSKSAHDWTSFYEQLEKLLTDMDIPEHLDKNFPVSHYHHMPKISLAGCPNGCSQPQIKDIGIAGYLMPDFTDAPCTGCRACVRACQEGALTWDEGLSLDNEKCLGCGDCIRACKTGKIAPGESGWSLYLGGRLGRHPHLARLCEETFQSPELLERIREIFEEYRAHGLPMERLTHFLDRRSF